MILGDSSFSVTPTHVSPNPEDAFICFDQNTVLLREGPSGLALPTVSEVACLLPAGTSPFELAHTAAQTLWSLPPAGETVLTQTDSLRYHPIGVFRSLPHALAAQITSCYHLWMWYRQNRFCGSCGHALSAHETERALVCGACGRVRYPTISPAVIVAITYGDSILLAKNAHSPLRHYTLISGYVEVGETLEHAARREVMEEVGLTLRTLRYLGDQPWGVSGSHMFAFQAEAEKPGPIVLQESELSDARWVARGDLSPKPDTVSVAFELIERFRTGTL